MCLRTWKIKIKNPKIIKPVFDKWFFDYKYSYNKCNMIINESTSYYSDYELRNMIIPKNVNAHIPWILETPKDIRAGAVFENCKNYKSAFTNLRNKNIKFFKMGYMKKRKKRNSYCFDIPGSALQVIQTNNKYDNCKRLKIYSSYTNDYIFHLSERIPQQCINNRTSCLLKEHKIYYNGENYYLLLAIEREPIDINCRKKTVAIDLGVRKLATTWDNQGVSYNFGNRKSIQIKHLLLKKNKYQSHNNTKEMNKIEIRIKNLINELHHKTSTFLCHRYSKIIIPELDVRGLIEKKFGKEYNKAILRMKIRSFISLLKTKGEIYKTSIYGTQEGVHEMYSSRLCSACKYINPKCSNEIKKCNKCGIIIDRDINASKNIYFMNKHLIC